MSKIIATADGKELIITKQGKHLSVSLNGELRDDLLPYLNDCVQALAPYAGSYYPPKGAMVGYLLALQQGAFFTEAPIIRIEGRIASIPHINGQIY